MINYIEKRVLETSGLMLRERLTVRQAAERVGFSKSTVYKDVTERLRDINYTTWKEMRALLDYHTQVRSIRGGLAVKKRLNK